MEDEASYSDDSDTLRMHLKSYESVNWKSRSECGKNKTNHESDGITSGKLLLYGDIPTVKPQEDSGQVRERVGYLRDEW